RRRSTFADLTCAGTVVVDEGFVDTHLAHDVGSPVLDQQPRDVLVPANMARLQSESHAIKDARRKHEAILGGRTSAEGASSDAGPRRSRPSLKARRSKPSEARVRPTKRILSSPCSGRSRRGWRRSRSPGSCG